MSLDPHGAVARVHRAVNRGHQGVDGSRGGGITGTIVPEAFCRVLDAMCKVEPAKGAVFCDAGSGAGHAVLSAAALGLGWRACVGFDVEPVQVFNSCAAWKRLAQEDFPLDPVGFAQRDAMRLTELTPATHVYAFVGYADFAKRVVGLAARSPSVRVLALVLPRRDALEGTGLFEDDADADVQWLTGLRMSGGDAHSCVVVRMAPELRMWLLEFGAFDADDDDDDDVQIIETLEGVCGQAQTPEGRGAARARGLALLDAPVRGARKAARRCAARCREALEDLDKPLEETLLERAQPCAGTLRAGAVLRVLHPKNPNIIVVARVTRVWANGAVETTAPWLSLADDVRLASGARVAQLRKVVTA
jgi:hypothetical protein